MTNNPKDIYLSKAILNVVNEKKPQSIKQLVKILQETFNTPESEILKIVLELQAQGSISLEDQNINSQNLVSFVTGGGLWYFLTIAIGAITATLVFTVPENFYPWIYGRNFLGLIFVLFLPGYAFVKAIFPIALPSLGKTASKEIVIIERLVLSVGSSIALISIVGLLLYYSPWGLSLPSIVISLFTFTAIFATAGMIRVANNEM